MGGWALNCALLLAMLMYFIATGDKRAPWSDVFMTLNAVLLAAAPAALYVLFTGDGHADH